MSAEKDREDSAARGKGGPAGAAGGGGSRPPSGGGDSPPAAGGAAGPPAASGGGVTRRGFFRFLGGTLGAAGGAAGLAGALSPLKDYDPSGFTAERFFQKHYKELTPGEKQKILERIEKEVWKRYHVKATVGDLPPLPGVEFGYALNLGRCIGCRRCVYACVAENNQSRSPEIQYIRVLAMPRGSVDLEHADLALREAARWADGTGVVVALDAEAPGADTAEAEARTHDDGHDLQSQRLVETQRDRAGDVAGKITDGA